MNRLVLSLTLGFGLLGFQGVCAQGSTRDVGGSTFDSGGSANIVAPDPPQTEVKVVTYTLVSKPRQWTDVDGRQVVASLMAFSAPQEGQQGPVIVIHEAKVRLFVSQTKKPAEFPLERLSKEDQEFVQQIATQARKGLPKPEPPAEEKEAEQE